MAHRIPILSLLHCAIACAQPDSDNAYESAQDAFGYVDGPDAIGLYSDQSIRGFSPVVAGNIRIEDLYFHEVSSLSSRISQQAIVQVGPAAQAYAFPAPTGIVNRTLLSSGDGAEISQHIYVDSYSSMGAELDGKLPLIPASLSAAAGVSGYRSHYADDGQQQDFTIGLVPRWRAANAGLIGFASLREVHNSTTQTLYVFDNVDPRTPIRRGHFAGPDWIGSDSHDDNAGLLGYVNLDNWVLRGGIFHAGYRDLGSYQNIVAIEPDSLSSREVVAYAPARTDALSGELRAARSIHHGLWQHRIVISLRGRDVESRYGAGERIALGRFPLNATLTAPKPILQPKALTKNRITEQAIGLSYTADLSGVANMTVGYQHVLYTNVMVAPEAVRRWSTRRGVPSFNGNVMLTKQLALYGSYVRGLEDAGAAPQFAANAGEILPASITRQYDAGMSWSPNQDARLILGYFDITKPYLAMNSNGLFGALGSEQHRGIEFSVKATKIDHFTILVGAMYSRPRVTPESNVSEPIGRRPVGQTNLLSRLDLEYAVPSSSDFAINMTLNYEGHEAGTTDNAVDLPSKFTIDVGARLGFSIAQRRCTLRASIANLTNEYGVYAIGSGVYDFLVGRNASLLASVEF